MLKEWCSNYSFPLATYCLFWLFKCLHYMKVVKSLHYNYRSRFYITSAFFSLAGPHSCLAGPHSCLVGPHSSLRVRIPACGSVFQPAGPHFSLRDRGTANKIRKLFIFLLPLLFSDVRFWPRSTFLVLPTQATHPIIDYYYYYRW